MKEEHDDDDADNNHFLEQRTSEIIDGPENQTGAIIAGYDLYSGG